MSFASLGLSPELLSAIDERGYTEPTPVQLEAIPAVLAGQDIWACAQTGSGKTAAFALPLLERVLRAHRDGHRVRSLVLVPTRELAAQVGESFRLLARSLQRPIKVAAVFGGVSINPQMMSLRGGADIVVATPGRLLDLVDQNALRLDAVETLVLDEADRLIDLGFADELRAILERVPPRRQNLLFSATFPDEVAALAGALLRDPLRIDVPATQALQPDIEQRSISIDPAKRTPLLRHLIAQHGWARVLVFVATKYSTEHIADKLRQKGIKAAALHGELSQAARTKALADFKNSQLQVLVATDVAARGIHIDRLPAVVNYDLPRSAVDYTHRIGRTGRAGEHGTAISFVSATTESHFRLIEKRHAMRLPREVIPGFEPAETSPATAPVTGDGHGGIKGRRKSKKDKLREAAARAQAAPADEAAGVDTGSIWKGRRPRS
ncbi:MAG: ATP-dependent helicase rhlE [Pseudomonadota bacterium]|jgi:ATP-dependent RNA helicase RhlE